MQGVLHDSAVQLQLKLWSAGPYFGSSCADSKAPARKIAFLSLSGDRVTPCSYIYIYIFFFGEYIFIISYRNIFASVGRGFGIYPFIFRGR